MTTYPNGVTQNFAAPGSPMSVGPVPESSWKWFAPPKEADTGLKMIQTVAKDAFMQAQRSGQYSQFIYRNPKNPPIVVRIAYGTAIADTGNSVLIMEYPSGIYDRSITPAFGSDQVNQQSGKPAVLKCREIAVDLGELYWTNE